MNPILTIWPTRSTDLLSAKVTALQNDAVHLELYSSLNCHDLCAEKLSEALIKKYRELIKLTASDTTLHTVIFVPLFDPDFNEVINKTLDAVKSTPDKISVHVIALRNSIARVIASNLTEQPDETEKINLNLLNTLALQKGFSYTILDDYVETGAPLDFTLNSLAEYVSFIISALECDYYRIFPPTLLSSGNEKNLAIGISNYRFNRKGACNLLLHEAFIYALEKSGIDNDNIDSQKALSEAISLLSGMDRKYDDFYHATVEPLYKQKMDNAGSINNMTDGDIAAQIADPMKQEMKDIETKLLSFLEDPDLSLPEKEGILALILGRDNARFQGVQYDQDTMILNDVCGKPLDTYIDTFNTIPPDDPDHSLLPIRGNFERLKKFIIDDDSGKVVESAENDEAFNPLPILKKLKREILDTTAFIRRKTEQLNQLEKLEDQHAEFEGKDTAHFPQQRLINSGIREQPLNDIYTPPAKLKRKDSVDLREYFSPVKDQGTLGSCTTFAVVAMYEAIMNRLQGRTGTNRANMSEQFIYHYSNVEKGRPEGGSNFFDQLEILGTKGVCEEVLFGYSSGNLGNAPSEEAIKDAEHHRVLKAKQIRLMDKGDKIDCIVNNHRILTSALTEGYPIGIALRVFKSFENGDAFINRPSETEILTGELESHAMVIVGYSEERKCYILRNSWGPDFGDKGYCYVSSSYIDDPEFNLFSCIITDTTEEGENTAQSTPALVAPFAGTQAQIDIAEIRNVLDESSLILNSNQTLFEEYYRYYSALIQRLCMPQIRNSLRKVAVSDCRQRLTNVQLEKLNLENTFIDILKEYKHELMIRALKASCWALGITAIAGAICYAHEWFSYTAMMTAVGAAILSIIIAVYFWIDKISKQRKKRYELKDRIKSLAIQENRLANELLEKQLQFHVAGMWIDSYHDLQISLDRTYNRLQEFNTSLRQWLAEDKYEISKFLPPDGEMFISCIDRPGLDRFFKNNADKLIRGVDLIKTFRGYNAGSETIEDARMRLLEDVEQAVAGLFITFRMFNLLSGMESYPYVKTEKNEDLIGKLISLGQPSTRLHSHTSNFPVRIVLLDISDQEYGKWSATMQRHFPSHVDILRVQDPDTLTLVTIRPVPADVIR